MKKRGFSFIELLTALVVASLLFALIVPEALLYMEEQKAASYKAAVNSIRDALDRYHKDHQSPRKWTDYKEHTTKDTKGFERTPVDDFVAARPSSLDALVEKGYLQAIPVDPYTGLDDWQIRQVGTDPNAYSGGNWTNWKPRNTVFNPLIKHDGIIDIRSNDNKPVDWNPEWGADPNSPANKKNWHHNDVINWYSAPSLNMWAPRGLSGR